MTFIAFVGYSLTLIGVGALDHNNCIAGTTE